MMDTIVTAILLVTGAIAFVLLLLTAAHLVGLMLGAPA